MKKKEIMKPGEYAQQFEIGRKKTEMLPMTMLQNRGRPKLYNDMDLLTTAIMNYFLWVNDHPIYKYENKVVDKELVEVSVPMARPYSVRGLVQYLGVSHDYFDSIMRGDRLPPSNILYEDFKRYWTDIKEMIYQQKYDGAAVGLFNAALIIRDLGLADKREIELPKIGDQIEFE